MEIRWGRWLFPRFPRNLRTSTGSRAHLMMSRFSSDDRPFRDKIIFFLAFPFTPLCFQWVNIYLRTLYLFQRLIRQFADVNHSFYISNDAISLDGLLDSISSGSFSSLPSPTAASYYSKFTINISCCRVAGFFPRVTDFGKFIYFSSYCVRFGNQER